ncbi:MAG: discoidin domain-containing protein [Odoribacteraceae bacterium]|nr:discoidin domain-containing protein [Odoribacteraceae bacterium]
MKKIFCFAAALTVVQLTAVGVGTGAGSPAVIMEMPGATGDSLATTKAPLAATGVRKINSTTAEVTLSGGRLVTLDFFGDNVVRLFRDDAGGLPGELEATPPARILADAPRRPVSKVEVEDDGTSLVARTTSMEVRFHKGSGLMTILSTSTGATAIEELSPPLLEEGRVTLRWRERPDEFFYGGGVQNGRFSHKGRAIAIENQNSWTDGGVASPAPFYWSTGGYAVLWHTFRRGRYDFGATEPGVTRLSHETGHIDIFIGIDQQPVNLLGIYYQLTGRPVLLPKFGFYQGHLNAYNRDFWLEDEGGILFEDGKRYRESQKDNGGTRESLNGEGAGYQFSARAVVDRYARHDMPLGWILPNDGYGAGYGREETLDGNVANLAHFGEYARERGVEIGLWTQSDLHPRTDIAPLLQRDLVKEVRDAGVRVLKTDVAWVGSGYSFGLNGIANAARVMSYYGGDCRPFIITLDGWAGTQRYAGAWTGDQTGGTWEYIRFHLPTYIGAGLSGQPNIFSDMDGIFGGKNPVVNTRDFQWKTFTPAQLNMDGWGANEKYPHALGEPAASINRWYLKLKSMLMPYAYGVAREAVDGLPMVRATFLEDPNPFTLGRATRYQFLYGENFLVAPIYQATRPDEHGNDHRDGIYLPVGAWIDYFTGERYEGGRVINNFPAPLWKLPLFVKEGAIIPITRPHNNARERDYAFRTYELYPLGRNAIEERDDDGASTAYLSGQGVSTRVEYAEDGKGRLVVTAHPTVGEYAGFVKEKVTEFRINVTAKPRKVALRAGNRRVRLVEARTEEEFEAGENIFLYHPAPELNRFATPGSDFEKISVVKNPLLLVKARAVDVTLERLTLTVDGFIFHPADRSRVTSGHLAPPRGAAVSGENVGAYTLTPSWEAVRDADFYEILFNGTLFSTIRDTFLLFDGLEPVSDYAFQLRAVNRDGHSDWVTFAATTAANPLEFAIKGMEATSTAESQGRSLRRLVDFEEGELWHTRYNVDALPFDLVIDARTINTLDKLHYIPRDNAGNGTITKGSVAYSRDGRAWTPAGDFEWARDASTKVFTFANNPVARYVKLTITGAVGGYGSGREIYLFKAPGTPSYLPGDINDDGKIDENDITSYRNYTGLRRGDADFDGYISRGDVNDNGLIDAYDISVAATRPARGGGGGEGPEGIIEISVPKRRFRAGETIEVRVSGKNLRDINAFSFAIPYRRQDYIFTGTRPLEAAALENFTNDRLHADGSTALYPTFVNTGGNPPLEGSLDLCILAFKAARDLTFDLKLVDGILVNGRLASIVF